MRMLREAMEALIKISGSSGLMDNNPAQRCWRDVHAISSHVVMNWDVPAENFGRAEFGLPLNPGLSDVLELDPEKWNPDFRKDHATKSLERQSIQSETIAL